MANDEDIKLALSAVRDAIAGVRAAALLMTGAQRHEVDQTALLMMMARTCACADHSLEVVISADKKEKNRG